MIEAICPGCFKSFTKTGSMHRHIYEDRCRSPLPRFVRKIKAEHDGRVVAAAARSACRAAARAVPAPAPAPADPPTPEQNPTRPVHGGGQRKAGQRPSSLNYGCGMGFAEKSEYEKACSPCLLLPPKCNSSTPRFADWHVPLQLSSGNGGSCVAQQWQWQPQDDGFDCFNTSLMSFNNSTCGKGWHQTQIQVMNGCGRVQVVPEP